MRTQSPARLIPAAFMCVCVIVAETPQTHSPSSQKSCFAGFTVARGADKKPIVLSTRALDEMATRRVLPTPPQIRGMQARIDGHCRAKILIDKDGVVKCAAVKYGHPLLTPSLLETVRQWRFRPYMVNGKPTAVLGYLDVHFAPSDPRFVLLDYDFEPPKK